MGGGVCEVAHARWVAQGELRKVGYASHLVKFFTP